MIWLSSSSTMQCTECPMYACMCSTCQLKRVTPWVAGDRHTGATAQALGALSSACSCLQKHQTARCCSMMTDHLLPCRLLDEQRALTGPVPAGSIKAKHLMQLRGLALNTSTCNSRLNRVLGCHVSSNWNTVKSCEEELSRQS